MTTTSSNPKRLRWLLGGTAIGSALLGAGVLALALSIAERKREAAHPFHRVVELDEHSGDPEVWGQNFPLQYDGWAATTDMQRTRFGGSEAIPHWPTTGDPRTLVSRSLLELEPRLARMWAGYAFAHDYREKRGHAYMLEDQTYTARVSVARQPGACIHCHASVWPLYRELGGGDVEAGFAAVEALSWAEARAAVEHPIACIDCHDPETMALRITRPAFARAIAELQRSRGVADYDVSRDATRAELRVYVCAQCHVEYYFEGPSKRLRHPWQRGLAAEDMLSLYDDLGFSDWTHAETGAAMLKAQHPEYELWSRGVHASAGVTCVDCHMPYMRVGATKITDHQINSPLLKIARACQGCHPADEATLLERVETIQSRTLELETLALGALDDLIDDIAAARAAGADLETLGPALTSQRRGTFLLDFVMAENSQGFHADQESARLLAHALEQFRLGQRALAGKPAASR